LFFVTFGSVAADYTMTAMTQPRNALVNAVAFNHRPIRIFLMNKQQLLTIALGSAFAAVAALPAQAAGNPFAAKQLDAGYQIAQADMKAETKAKDGKCGEAKCGADKKMDKKKDGKCGEAKCGADKKAKEASCGGDKKKDASCGAKKS
jgi:uncharacterized low-complexity protein